MNIDSVRDLFGWADDPADIVLAADTDSARDGAARQFAYRLRQLRPDWMADAACRTSDVDMFATGKAEIDEALALCGRCPVMVACRRWALTAEPNPLPYGVAGGMTAKARKNARRLTPRKKAS